jgi:predicted GNAT family acetyltransferase
VESPFEGDVTLWPRHAEYRQVREGEGLWEIEYTPVQDGVRGKGIRYFLAGSQLQRVGAPGPARHA